MREKERKLIEAMTPEEERAYFDAQDPLLQGKKVRLHRVEPPADRMSYFALRIKGEDIDRLYVASKQRGMKISELARSFILEGLARLEAGNGGAGADNQMATDVLERVAALEEGHAEMKKTLLKLAESAGEYSSKGKRRAN